MAGRAGEVAMTGCPMSQAPPAADVDATGGQMWKDGVGLGRCKRPETGGKDERGAAPTADRGRRGESARAGTVTVTCLALVTGRQVKMYLSTVARSGRSRHQG